MQKARRHPEGLRPLVGVRFQVLFHSPVRSTFHLSLTVLVHYRSLRSIQPYRMVPADSHRVSRAPRYSGYYQVLDTFRVRDYHSLWLRFPNIFHYISKVHIVVLQPQNCRNNLGLGYFHFARRYYGNHYCFLFLRLLRCFSSARQRLSTTCLQHARFPHSEMSGSKNICFSPNLIAAYHVLLRL